jgi:hypothetical protein
MNEASVSKNVLTTELKGKIAQAQDQYQDGRKEGRKAGRTWEDAEEEGALRNGEAELPDHSCTVGTSNKDQEHHVLL